ncbi:UNVERIFIED_CONTAM: glycosyltransferase [Kocuria sp. CPCC 205274]
MSIAHFSHFLPSRVLSVDLGTNKVEVPAPSERPPAAYSRIRALVRVADTPIGFVELEGVTTDDDASIVEMVRTRAWDEFREDLIDLFAKADLPAPSSSADLKTYAQWSAKNVVAHEQVLVSVVISTLQNDEAAMATAARVLEGAHESLDVIIVDNSDSPEPLAAKVAQRFSKDSRVRHVLERRRGLSRARNKGLEVARGDIIVLTDDDVIVDRLWITKIVEAFDLAPNVGCVTGAIVPAELETPAQELLEQFGGFNKGFATEVFNMTDHRRPGPLYPYDSGRFGSGANIAFRRACIDEIGGFTNHLGVGTPAWGGEDIDVLRRTITAGYTLVYVPSALMWHRHRRSYDALRRQMYRYGVGLSATVTKWVMEDRGTAIEVARRLPAGVLHILGPKSRKNKAKTSTYPISLTLLELAGLLVGPFAYFRSRRAARSVDSISKKDAANVVFRPVNRGEPHGISGDPTSE